MLAKSDGENEILRRKVGVPTEASELSESSANKQKAIQFLNTLEFLLEKELRQEDLDIECPSGHSMSKSKHIALEELSRSGQFIFDRGSSPKIILDHLALALPVL